MTLPNIIHYKPEHADSMRRLEPGDFGSFPATGPAATLTLDDIPMACLGYEYFSGYVYGWLMLSDDAKGHPGVPWAIKMLVNDAIKLVGTMVIMVRDDWPEAHRFAKWLGFIDIGLSISHEITYSLYRRTYVC